MSHKNRHKIPQPEQQKIMRASHPHRKARSWPTEETRFAPPDRKPSEGNTLCLGTRLSMAFLREKL